MVDQQANVKQWFPEALLGVYKYSVTDSSTTTCGIGSVWDGCTNRTTVNFNYTQCSTEMFGSSKYNPLLNILFMLILLARCFVLSNVLRVVCIYII